MTRLASMAVISHERHELRERAVASAVASVGHCGADIPVMLIDSSSDTGAGPAGARLVHRPDEPSCVGKRRLAFDLADSEWVILLDDDCRVALQAVGRLLDAMADPAHAKTAALFVVTAFDGAQTAMFRAALHSDLAAGFGDTANVGDIDWGVTTLSAFRRTAVLSVDAFAKDRLDVPVGGEDVDACIRLRAAGWRVFGLPDVLALHDTATWSTFGQNARRARNYGAAEAELVRSFPERSVFGYDNLLITVGLGYLCARVVGAAQRPAAILGLAGWAAAEASELRRQHPEATWPEIGVQAVWSAAYEGGRLRQAAARRQPELAARRFNWNGNDQDGYSARFTPGQRWRLLIAAGVVLAGARLLRRNRSQR